jgi:hypothetical protein
VPDSGFFISRTSIIISGILQSNTVLYKHWLMLYDFTRYYAAFFALAKQYALEHLRVFNAA